MSIFSVSKIPFLRSIGIRLTNKSPIYFRSFVTIRDQLIPVSFQITFYLYKDVKCRTFNFNNEVFAIVVSPEDIFFVPNTFYVQQALSLEKYVQDLNLYVPSITLDSLESKFHCLKWYYALIWCN